jgi:hypothetical protein
VFEYASTSRWSPHLADAPDCVGELPGAEHEALDAGGRCPQEKLGVRVGIERGVERPLGNRHIIRLADESAELPRRDRCLVDPEPVNGDAMDRLLLGIEVVGAHRERSAGNPAHAWIRRRPVRVGRGGMLRLR